MEKDFGIYIKTFEKDYYLAKVLISSLNKYAGDVDIMLIIDDDNTGHRMWGKEVLKFEDEFLLSIKGYFRKLWGFYGPYKKFLLLDADQLALKSLHPLIERIRNNDPPFFLANKGGYDEYFNKDNDFKREKHEERLSYNIKLIEEFDPSFDWLSVYPFNSGNFASTKDLIDLNSLKKLYHQADIFNQSAGYPPFNNSRDGLFMSDQGMINYIVHHHLKLNVQYIDNLYFWGGHSIKKFKSSKKSNYFIHWAGCPRPTFLRRNVPAGDIWIELFYEYYKNRNRREMIWDIFKNSCFDLNERFRGFGSRIKKRLLSHLSALQ